MQNRLGLSSYADAVALYNSDLGAIANALGPVKRTGNQTINMPKLDWQVNEKNHVSAIYNRLGWRSPGGVQTQATNNYSIDGFGNDYVKLDYGLAKLDTVLTPTIVNEVRYQYGRELDNENYQPVSAYNSQFIGANAYQGLPPQSRCRARTASAIAFSITRFAPPIPMSASGRLPIP